MTVPFSAVQQAMAANTKRYMEAAGHDAATLAERSGVRPHVIRAIRAGDLAKLRVVDLQKIAGVLEVEEADLLRLGA